MRKHYKVFSLLTIATAAFLINACGKSSAAHFKQAGAGAAQSAATNNFATAIQGYWTNCANGYLTSYSFYGNGYWMEQDLYESKDCSDDDSMGMMSTSEGTFALGNPAQAGYAQQITFNPTSGQQITGSVAVISSTMMLTVNGVETNLALYNSSSN